MDDTSLDDFGEPADEGDSAAETTPETDASEAAAPARDVDEAAAGPADADGDGATDTVDSEETGAAPDEQTTGVAPATTTYAWSASRATCDDCGEGVERRWEDGDGRLVCSECKEW